MKSDALTRLAAAVDARALDLTKPLPWAVKAELSRETGIGANALTDQLYRLRVARGISVPRSAVRTRKARTKPLLPPAAPAPTAPAPPPVRAATSGDPWERLAEAAGRVGR